MSESEVQPNQSATAQKTNAILLLGVPDTSTNIVYNALAKAFGPFPVVQEAPFSRVTLIQRRIRKLGYAKVAGQILFSATVVPLLTVAARGRIQEIIVSNGLDTSPIPENRIQRVSSVNSEESWAALRESAADIVVINGTRILSRATLTCVDRPFINMHAGITPQYRGVHGGYWAFADGAPELAGTTVHVLDTGIDTGPILGQGTFRATKKDSFATYPYLHLATGLPILISSVRRILDGENLWRQEPLPGARASVLRYHPTAWQYVSLRVTGRAR